MAIKPLEQFDSSVSRAWKMQLVRFLEPFFRDKDTGEFGPWHYTLPIAPADVPKDFKTDPHAGAFVSPWGNVAGAPPAAWRVAPRGIEVQLGGVTGGEGTPGGTIMTLPTSAPLPDDDTPQFGGLASNKLAKVLVQTNGAVVFVQEIVGDPGVTGATGQAAYTQTTLDFTQPATSATVSVSVISTSWMTAGMILYITGGGFYSVSSVTNSTTVVLTNMDVAGNAAAGATISNNAGVSAGGQVGSRATNGTLNFLIDGQSNVIANGIKGDAVVDYACTIIGWDLLADQSGSITVDIWKTSYSGAPPTVSNTITASAIPAIASATKATSSTLTGWTTAVAAGDVLRFNVSGVTSITRVTLSLKLLRS